MARNDVSKDTKTATFSALRNAVLAATCPNEPTTVPIELKKWPDFDKKLRAKIFGSTAYFDLQRQFKTVDYALTHPKIVAETVITGVVDEQGLPVFLEEDRATIEANGNGDFYDALSHAVLVANGFVEPRVEVEQDKVNVGNSNATGG